MLYREAGQFKSTYAEDQRIFPIRQDRIAFWLLMVIAFVVVPMVGNQYWLGAMITPFLIFALATLGLNILTGYAGQLSLGTAAFMAVGAFMTYNFVLRLPWLGIVPSMMLGGLCAGLALAKISGALLQPFDLDVYVAGTFLPRRAHEKLSPVDPVGDYVSEGFVLQLGVGSRWRF